MKIMQESQVAAMFAQAYAGGVSGSDTLDKALLDGRKEDGTDFHSLAAKVGGLSRSVAKELNYGLN